MQTKCPTCSTVFRLKPEHLQIAGGQVRCGHCLNVFDGRAHLVQEEDATQAGNALASREREPMPDSESPRHSVRSTSVAAAADAPRGTPTQQPDWDDRFGASSAPRRSGFFATLIWVVLILTLVTLLLAQYAYYNREQLARHEALRPWLEAACAELEFCTLTPRRDPQAFVLVDRDVRVHPEYEKSLLIDAAFINQAHFAQPYPQVTLELRNVTDDIVASRLFLPDEYLGKPADKEKIAAGAEVHLVLEVLDPGPEAVSFEFSFH